MANVLFAALSPETVANTLGWQQTVPIITGTCLLVLFIASRRIAHPHVGPKMPLGPLGPLFNNISVAGFIASMSFGHILGALLALGVANYVQPTG